MNVLTMPDKASRTNSVTPASDHSSGNSKRKDDDVESVDMVESIDDSFDDENCDEETRELRVRFKVCGLLIRVINFLPF